MADSNCWWWCTKMASSVILAPKWIGMPQTPWHHPNMNQGPDGRQRSTMPTRPNASTAQIAGRPQMTLVTPKPALMQHNHPVQPNRRATGAQQHSKSDDIIVITAYVTNGPTSISLDFNQMWIQQYSKTGYKWLLMALIRMPVPTRVVKRVFKW